MEAPPGAWTTTARAFVEAGMMELESMGFTVDNVFYHW
jgi:hypothetical protein